MWDLEQNAGAIAGFGIASAGAAVRQIEQHLDSLFYNFVAFVAANVGHESDSAGVVLLRRMVQPLGGWRAIRFLPTRRHGHVCMHLASLRVPGRSPNRLFSTLFVTWTLAAKATGAVAYSRL